MNSTVGLARALRAIMGLAVCTLLVGFVVGCGPKYGGPPPGGDTAPPPPPDEKK